MHLNKTYPVLLLGIIAIIVVSLFAIMSESIGHTAVQACTSEAKICPDGSAVGRTGPNCEFAQCPVATSTVPQSFECNGDGFVCPDGSTVGRTGSDCHFAACPLPGATSATIRTTLGQKMTGLNVTVTPIEVTDDSRCPQDVQCIWAGTVKVRTKISSGLGESEMTFELGAPMTTEAEEITLTDVSPAKTSSEAIPGSSYRFTYEIKKTLELPADEAEWECIRRGLSQRVGARVSAGRVRPDSDPCGYIPRSGALQQKRF